MADLNSEQYGQLPDFLKEDYTEVDGVYKHAGMLKVKQTANDLDSRLKARDSEFTQLSDRLTASEQAKAQEISEAREAALEEARSNNNVDDILRLEREKLDDEKVRLNLQREELTKTQESMAGDKKNNIADRLTSHATEQQKLAFNRLVKDYILVDAGTRQETFLNEDGSASSLNEQQFIEELKTRPLFKSLMKAGFTTEGGGDANGSLDGSASQKAPKDMTGQERMEWKNRDPVGFNKHFKLNK